MQQVDPTDRTIPTPAAAAPDPLEAGREARRTATKLARRLIGSTVIVYATMGAGILLFLTQHRWNGNDIGPRIVVGASTGITSVLALAATLTVALNVGVYNLEKDKTSDTDRENPAVHLRFRVFEVGAFSCSLMAATAGLLAISTGKDIPSITGALQLTASVIIVILGQLVVLIRPDEFADDPVADAHDRAKWATVAARYWRHDGSTPSLNARHAWLQILSVPLVLPLVLRYVWTHQLGASWTDPFIPWIYLTATVGLGVSLWKMYLQRLWPFVVMYGVGAVGTSLIFIASALYDASLAKHSFLTGATWAIVAIIGLVLASFELTSPMDSSGAGAGATVSNRPLASLSYLWLREVIDEADKPRDREETDRDGAIRRIFRRLSRWHIDATGRVAGPAQTDLTS